MVQNTPSSIERFFDRFSEQARRVLVLAQEEAALLGHNYVGTEHLLLGLLREETGVAAIVLKEFGVELGQVRAMVERVVGRGSAEPDVERRFTPRAQVVITLAVSEAWRASAIDTEHILLGLVREGEGLAAGALETLGVPLDQVRLRVYQVLARGSAPESVRELFKSKSNVVTCRVDDRDLDAIDALVEVGIRSTRSDAASWLIHAGIDANLAIFESVYATVAEIRLLRTKAQAIIQQVTKNGEVPPQKSGEPPATSAGPAQTSPEASA
jgi:hypothetical protein